MRQGGFSLLETVVALGLLSLLLVAVIPSFFVMMHANTRNEERSAAVGAARASACGRCSQMIRAASTSDLPTS